MRLEGQDNRPHPDLTADGERLVLLRILYFLDLRELAPTAAPWSVSVSDNAAGLRDCRTLSYR